MPPSVVRIAHRGASGLYPENTLLAYRRAIEQGVDMLEVDVHRTRDGELVIIHASTLERTTNGSGRVRDHTLAQLRAFDAGQGERIPAFLGRPLKPEFAFGIVMLRATLLIC